MKLIAENYFYVELYERKLYWTYSNKDIQYNF